MRTQADTHAQPGAIKAEVLSVSFVPASAPLLPNMAPTIKRWGTELKIENARAGNAWKCVYVCVDVCKSRQRHAISIEKQVNAPHASLDA